MLQTLRDLIVRIIDAPGPDYDLGRAAWWGADGLIHGTHLTDDPSHVRAVLAEKTPLAEGRTRREKYGDLGAGLYVSDAPQLWVGRSTGKWAFLETLKASEMETRRECLAIAILAKLREMPKDYITRSEREHAVLTLERYIEDGDTYIVNLADQPYNVLFWEPRFLEPLGIRAGTQAVEIEVVMRGHFAELARHPTIPEIEVLQDPRSELDGAYTRSGFSTYPQMVVWRNEAVVAFG